jgi:putative hemolysin
MKSLSRGRYLARKADSEADLIRAQAFRARCFGLADAHDADPFDLACGHILVEVAATGALVCTFRMLPLSGAALTSGYCAQFYDLSALARYPGAIVEMGRFCIDPDVRDPDILRVAWAAMTHYVDDNGVDLLIGCSSFGGTEASGYLDTFALLKARHLAPARWKPRIKAGEVFRFAARLRRKPDLAKALRHMPPLLRTYLMMGGWVSDHAVVDRQMNTLHVFTAVEIDAIPEARKRVLRAVL